MAIGIKGHGDGGVSQKLLHQLGMNASAQEKRSAGVPEVVKPYFWQTGPIQKRLEGPFDYVLGIEGRALQRSENQIMIFLQAGEPHSLF